MALITIEEEAHEARILMAEHGTEVKATTEPITEPLSNDMCFTWYANNAYIGVAGKKPKLLPLAPSLRLSTRTNRSLCPKQNQKAQRRNRPHGTDITSAQDPTHETVQVEHLPGGCCGPD